jgi:hypothetical protein
MQGPEDGGIEPRFRLAYPHTGNNVTSR